MKRINAAENVLVLEFEKTRGIMGEKQTVLRFLQLKSIFLHYSQIIVSLITEFHYTK